MELECVSNKDIKSNIFSLKDGVFQNEFNDSFTFFKNKNSSTESKKDNKSFSSCRIISSLFTKNLKETFYESNDKIINEIKTSDKKENIDESNKISINNEIGSTYLINYDIYNIKSNSFFHVKIFDKYIKYFPIFSELTHYEKYINYNPLIEKNPNFEIISPDDIHFNFSVKDYNISQDKVEFFKGKYIKHNLIKRNIFNLEDIFKYLFEEIKINISCIDIEKPYEEILKYCSKLINDINEIIEEIIKGFNKDMPNKNGLKINLQFNKNIIKDNNCNFDNINNFQTKTDKDKYCLFNNNIYKKNYILNCINSKGIEYNFFENGKIKEKDKTANLILTEENNKKIEFSK